MLDAASADTNTWRPVSGAKQATYDGNHFDKQEEILTSGMRTSHVARPPEVEGR